MQRFHGHRLRRHRIIEPGGWYAITAVCADRKPCLAWPGTARVVVQEIRRLDLEAATSTFTFVVMPDHIHWLLGLRSQLGLPEVMRRLKGRTAIRLRPTSVSPRNTWQPGYYERRIRSIGERQRQAIYIIANPVRAGLVEAVGDYAFWDICWHRWNNSREIQRRLKSWRGAKSVRG